MALPECGGAYLKPTRDGVAFTFQCEVIRSGRAMLRSGRIGIRARGSLIRRGKGWPPHAPHHRGRSGPRLSRSCLKPAVPPRGEDAKSIGDKERNHARERKGSPATAKAALRAVSGAFGCRHLADGAAGPVRVQLSPQRGEGERGSAPLESRPRRTATPVEKTGLDESSYLGLYRSSSVGTGGRIMSRRP